MLLLIGFCLYLMFPFWIQHSQSTDHPAKAQDTSTSVDAGKGNDPNTEAGELGDPLGMGTGVKVRVSRIKKVVADDEEDGDVDGEIVEKDLEAHELEELKMNRRIKQATKKMEEMVKQQLRDSGVVPSGSIVFSNALLSTAPTHAD